MSVLHGSLCASTGPSARAVVPLAPHAVLPQPALPLLVPFWPFSLCPTYTPTPPALVSSARATTTAPGLLSACRSPLPTLCFPLSPPAAQPRFDPRLLALPHCLGGSRGQLEVR